MATTSIKKRSQTKVATYDFSLLPDECWEHIFKFILNNDDTNNFRFESLSLVSKQFLSITNRLKFSLTINCYPMPPYLDRLFHRFTNLNSLDLSRYDRADDRLNILLCRISRFPLTLKSLNLSNQINIPAMGLRVFSKKITTLTSLICSNIYFMSNTDFNLIADCFPLLEELDLSKPTRFDHQSDFFNGIDTLSLALSKLRKINLSGHKSLDEESLIHLLKNCKLLEEADITDCDLIDPDGIAFALRERSTLRSLSFCNTHYTSVTSLFIDSLMSLKYLTCLELFILKISDELLSSMAMEGLALTRLVLQYCTGFSHVGIYSLLSKCQHLQHLDLENADFLNDQHVAKVSSFLGDLVSINLNYCSMLTESSLLSLFSKCLSLSEIQMGCASIGKENVENSNSLRDVVVSRQLKSLSLACNAHLGDENIIWFASIFPNLQLLNLTFCSQISEEGICQVLKRCCNIRHLNISYCSKVKSLGMNFEVLKLEVLNLSYTKVDDEALYVISKSCCGLLQLYLENCHVTEKAVNHVIEKCTQLREMILDDKFAVSRLFSGPSLRKITYR